MKSTYIMIGVMLVCLIVFNFVIRPKQRKSNTASGKKINLSLTILVILCIPLLILIQYTDADIIMPVLIIGLVILGFVYVIRQKSKKAAVSMEAKIAAQSAYAFTKEYDIGSTGVLKVTKKSEKAAAALEIKEIHDIHVTDTPDKLVYTGATVGGITTGGFHVEKGGTSMSLGEGTGRWAVSYLFAGEFNGQPWSETVVYMQLTDVLFAEVKKDKYLQKLIVTNKRREEWRTQYDRKELANVPNLINVIGMDEATAKHLGDWLAGRV